MPNSSRLKKLDRLEPSISTLTVRRQRRPGPGGWRVSPSGGHASANGKPFFLRKSTKSALTIRFAVFATCGPWGDASDGPANLVRRPGRFTSPLRMKLLNLAAAARVERDGWHSNLPCWLPTYMPGGVQSGFYGLNPCRDPALHLPQGDRARWAGLNEAAPAPGPGSRWARRVGMRLARRSDFCLPRPAFCMSRSVHHIRLSRFGCWRQRFSSNYGALTSRIAAASSKDFVFAGPRSDLCRA